ncbi:MAG: hypothetical protein GKR94_12040 [Gammaproteobacteria bacterium]|nr:hypothetical protein [Gammaproteobacteria bacterium]
MKWQRWAWAGICKRLRSKLAGAEANELSDLQFAEQLAEFECRSRMTKRIDLHRRQASFPVHKAIEEFDFRPQTALTKRQINQWLDLQFIDQRAHLIFIGPPGTGKTHLAIAIGNQAIDARYKVCCSPPPMNGVIQASLRPYGSAPFPRRRRAKNTRPAARIPTRSRVSWGQYKTLSPVISARERDTPC